MNSFKIKMQKTEATKKVINNGRNILHTMSFRFCKKNKLSFQKRAKYNKEFLGIVKKLYYI